MTRRPGRGTAAARAVLAILLVGACVTPPPIVGPSPAATTTAPPPTPTPLAIQPGGTLRVGLPREIGPLDPGLDDDAARPVLDQLYEGLVRRGPDGALAGLLATKWSVAPDGRTWTFTLREGVVFHDGAPLDAAAAARSLARRADDPIVERATADGAATLTVVTRSPYGPFLSTLASPAYAIVRVGAANVGTGPFAIAPGTADARPLVLQRNSRYWRADARGTALPYLDRVTFAAYPDAASRLAALRGGDVDLVTEIALTDVPTVRSDPSLRLVSRAPTTVLALGLNLLVQPLDDLRVRRAIAQTLNGRTLVDRLFAGEGRPASQFPPPGVLGHDDSVMEFARNDIDAAKRLLADAGNGPLDFSIWYVLGAPTSRPDDRRVAEAVAADLAAAGIGLGLKTIDPITFAQSVRENRYGLWIESVTVRAFDADELLGRTFIPPVEDGKDQPTAGGAWVNAEAAGLLRKARTEPDESKRAELYKQVSKIVQREVPRIPLVWSSPAAAATRKVLSARADVFVEVGMGK